MKKIVITFFALFGLALLNGYSQPAPPALGTDAANMSAPNADSFTSDLDRESYALGMAMGHGWKTHDVPLNLDMVFRGIEDEESNAPTLLNEGQMRMALQQLQQSVATAQQKAQSEEAGKNKQEGDAFLAQNKTKPGVVTLPDGLQYKVVTEGTGASPGPYDTVVVNYTGKFVDGTVFDSSERNGPPSHPAEFPVRAVIPGWTEGLQKMTVGSKWELYIPSDLAYGPMGRPPAIGPNETLIFDVELLAIKPGTPPPTPQPLTSDIIKVPSAQEMKNGAKIETIKASDLSKMQQTATN